MSDTASCYVVVAEFGASAVCVIDGSPPSMVEKFLRDNRRATLDVVPVARARQMLSEYAAWKRTMMPK